MNRDKIKDLKNNIDIIDNSRDYIIDLWLKDSDVLDILLLHKIETEYFKLNFAHYILDYYIDVVRGVKEIGDCPVIAKLLEYLKDKDISSSELFVICTHFRKAMVDVCFTKNIMSNALYDGISYVFDNNFRGVLESYQATVLKAKNDKKEQEDLFKQFNIALDKSALLSKTDLEGNITYVNPLFEKISGYSKDELLGKNHNIVRHPDMPKEFFKNLWDTIEKREIFQGTIKNRAKDGSAYFVETTIMPISNIQGEVVEYLAIRYEVSELIEARDAAIQAERSKDLFLANMSHEIRTPLNAILGFVDILRKRDHDAKESHYLNIIHSSGQTLLSIISDILDFAKIKNGKMSIDKHQFNISDEIKTVVELFKSTALEKDISYISYIDPKLPSLISGDSVRIKQVLTNFLSNAFKFTHKKGEVFVKIELKKNLLCISVKDNGSGMTLEQQKRVFQAFEQAENSTTRKHGGTGLGLFICSKLALMMGGDINLKSELDRGSMFEVVIPIDIIDKDLNTYHLSHKEIYLDKDALSFNETKVFAGYVKNMYGDVLNTVDISDQIKHQNIVVHANNVDDIELEKMKKIYDEIIIITPSVNHGFSQRDDIKAIVLPFNPDEVNDIFGFKCASDSVKTVIEDEYFNYHILVAEDNLANQQFISIVLEELGFTFDIAENGLVATQKVQDNEYDLILMDQQMPIMGGLEASKKIKEELKLKEKVDIPIIALTANALKGDREYYMENGLDEYIKKPIDQEEFKSTISKFLKPNSINENRVNKKEEKIMSINYGTVNAEELAAKIGLKVKHIPILVGTYIEEGESILNSLKEAIESKDYENIQLHAHSLKGSSGNLKFDELYELAKEIELSAKNKDESYDYEGKFEELSAGVKSIKL